MRDIPVGNGSLLVNFDDKYQIRDIYFPHVGQENHTEGYPSRFGVWVDGQFSWVSSDDWQRQLKYIPDTLVTEVTLSNTKLQVSIVCNDTVASHDNIFLRRMTVTNNGGSEKEIRLFLHHDLRIYENKVGDTAYFDPETHSIIHYKKHRYFLIATEPPFTQFVTGRKAFRENEGTWRDAEDGTLAGNVTTEGSVDSTIAVHLSLAAGTASDVFYWIAAGTTDREAEALNSKVILQQPQKLLEATGNEWRAWVNKKDLDFHDLSPEMIAFYRRSLITIHSQIDNGGAILAANDHDVAERATDHYSYLWTRDGAFVAHALDVSGYGELSRGFFEFCCDVIHERGYFLQKYNPDRTVASSWHPSWDVYAQRPIEPIQEDETALVIWALWHHYERYCDIDFALHVHRQLSTLAADFMVGFRDPVTGLPKPSWNLWEDRRGVHTFTCAAVVAGLRAAANFADLFNENDKALEYRNVADEIVKAMAAHLYSQEHGRFLRGLLANGDASLVPDPIIDASLFGVFYLGCFDVDDPMVTTTMAAVIENLSSEPHGTARFQNDGYMRTSDRAAGNTWFICTLWVAEYYIAKAKQMSDLKAALEILEWVTEHALPSGVLPEQLDPVTGDATSVSPLTWSHSTFVAAVHSYVDKKRALAAIEST